MALDAAVLDMLVDEARARIDRQLSNNDSLDVKAAAVLAAATAIIAIVFSSLDKWPPIWPVPVILSGLAAIPASIVLLPKTYHTGPDLKDFYEKHGHQEHSQAALQMLAELGAAVEHNRGLLNIKAWRTRAALIALFAVWPITLVFWAALTLATLSLTEWC